MVDQSLILEGPNDFLYMREVMYISGVDEPLSCGGSLTGQP